MKKPQVLVALLSLFSLPALSQLINMAGPATGAYVADRFCTGSAWGPTQDPAMAAQTGVYQTEKYGAISCDVPVAVTYGTCSVKLDLLENRASVPVGATPASAVGTRLFTVTVNGVSTGTIDIFAAVGAQTPYSPPPLIVPVVDGHVRAVWSGSKGNPVGSGIEVTDCSATPRLTSMMSCTGTTSPTSDCTGLYYVDVITPSGTELKTVGSPVTAPLDPKVWSLSVP